MSQRITIVIDDPPAPAKSGGLGNGCIVAILAIVIIAAGALIWQQAGTISTQADALHTQAQAIQTQAGALEKMTLAAALPLLCGLVLLPLIFLGVTFLVTYLSNRSVPSEPAKNYTGWREGDYDGT